MLSRSSKTCNVIVMALKVVIRAVLSQFFSKEMKPNQIEEKVHTI
jgi:uncharacterized membrane protein